MEELGSGDEALEAESDAGVSEGGQAVGARRERRNWKWPCNRSPRDRRDRLHVDRSTSEHVRDSQGFVDQRWMAYLSRLTWRCAE